MEIQPWRARVATSRRALRGCAPSRGRPLRRLGRRRLLRFLLRSQRGGREGSRDPAAKLGRPSSIMPSGSMTLSLMTRPLPIGSNGAAPSSASASARSGSGNQDHRGPPRTTPRRRGCSPSQRRRRTSASSRRASPSEAPRGTAGGSGGGTLVHGAWLTRIHRSPALDLETNARVSSSRSARRRSPSTRSSTTATPRDSTSSRWATASRVPEATRCPPARSSRHSRPNLYPNDTMLSTKGTMVRPADYGSTPLAHMFSPQGTTRIPSDTRLRPRERRATRMPTGAT